MVCFELLKILALYWLATLFLGIISTWATLKMSLFDDWWMFVDNSSLKLINILLIALVMIVNSRLNIKEAFVHYPNLFTNLSPFVFLCISFVYCLIPVFWVARIWKFFYERNMKIRLKKANMQRKL